MASNQYDMHVIFVKGTMYKPSHVSKPWLPLRRFLVTSQRLVGILAIPQEGLLLLLSFDLELPIIHKRPLRVRSSDITVGFGVAHNSIQMSPNSRLKLPSGQEMKLGKTPSKTCLDFLLLLVTTLILGLDL